MIRIATIACALLIGSVAWAQTSQQPPAKITDITTTQSQAIQPIVATTYAPMEPELWNQMKTALRDVPMSMDSHLRIQEIIKQAEREAIRQYNAKIKPGGK